MSYILPEYRKYKTIRMLHIAAVLTKMCESFSHFQKA